MASVEVFRFCLAMLSAAAGLIHIAAAPPHFAESPLHGLFFVVAGLLQIVVAGWLLRGGGTPLLRATAAGNVMIVALWAVSRTTGLPVGPERWTPEPVGFADVACSLIEVLIVAGCLMLLSTRGRRLLDRATPYRSRTTLVAAGSVLLVLTLFSVVALGSESHVHGGGLVAEALSHGSHAGAVHTADDHSTHTDASHPDPSDPAGTASGHSHGGTAASPAAEAAGHDHAGAPSAAGDHHTGAAVNAAGDHQHTATSGHTTAGHSAASGDTHASHDHAAEPAVATQAIGPASTDQRGSVRYGPFVLPPASLGGMLHVNLLQPTLAKPCSNCFVTSMSANLIYADGSTANLDTGPMLHHAVWTRPLVPDTTCGLANSAVPVVGLLGERFFAAGNERTTMTMPTGFGYYVGDDPWALVTEIMNHSEELKVVFIQLDATWRPAPDSSVKPVKPVWLDVANCGTSEFHVGAGPVEKTWSWTSTITGRIVATAGHLHDGGKEITLADESTGKQVCTSAARYGTRPDSMGSLDSMSVCAWDALGVVRAGDVLGIHAHYDRAQPADDVMGIMLAFVQPTDDLGGSPAPDSARMPVAPQAPAPAPGGHVH